MLEQDLFAIPIFRKNEVSYQDKFNVKIFINQTIFLFKKNTVIRQTIQFSTLLMSKNEKNIFIKLKSISFFQIVAIILFASLHRRIFFSNDNVLPNNYFLYKICLNRSLLENLTACLILSHRLFQVYRIQVISRCVMFIKS